MNRYNYNKKEELGILERMALLREQRNLIKAIYNIREDDEIATKMESQARVEAYLGMANEAEILGYVRRHCVLSGEKKGSFPTEENQKGYFKRCSKLGTLLQSCVEAEFLTPMTRSINADSKIPYLRITDRGSDLLHFLGFCQIAFEKYSKIIVFFWGAMSIIALKALTWVLANWQIIKTVIFD